jgi:hypothetical protein
VAGAHLHRRLLFLAGAVIADYQKSIEQYRNIETGEDFTGY